jgi:hypothetical protein
LLLSLAVLLLLLLLLLLLQGSAVPSSPSRNGGYLGPSRFAGRQYKVAQASGMMMHAPGHFVQEAWQYSTWPWAKVLVTVDDWQIVLLVTISLFRFVLARRVYT